MSYSIAMTSRARVRVAGYVTRQHQGWQQLLVFSHRDFPGVGLQVPAGGVAVGETLTHAVQREVWEESGLQVAVGETLGAHAVPHPVTDEPRLTVFFTPPLTVIPTPGPIR